MQDKIWGYLMHLGDNMWGDPGSRLRYEPAYYPELQVDDSVWRETIDFLPAQGFNMVLIDVGDGIQYDSHPEISVKGAWPKEKLKAELDRMRAMGLTPYPKLNFSAGHDAWLGVYSRMLSTPKYYEVCRDLILEVAELFDTPKYFHLGLDEEDPINQGGLSMIIVRQMELYWHDVYKLFDYCEEAGVTPWVWSTYSWTDGHLEEYLRRMPKDVLQSNGWYNRFKKLPDGTYTAKQVNIYKTLDEAGYKQIMTGSLYENYSANYYETMKMWKEELSDNVLGVMAAPWFNPRTKARYNLLNDAYRFGFAKQEVFPEYCK